MSTPFPPTPREPVHPNPQRPGKAQADTDGPAEALNSENLLAGRREILIQHGRSVYRLRHTSNDKLILTK